MALKPEIIHILQREKAVCETAMQRLQEKTRLLENQFGWPTHTFLELFKAGKIGDNKSSFVGMHWRKRCENGGKPRGIYKKCYPTWSW